MKKEGISYLLINITFFLFSLYLLHKLNILNSIINTLILILLSVILSYIIYPIYNKLEKRLNNIISLILIYILILLLVSIIIYLIITKTNFIYKIIDLFNNILKFEKIINTRFNIKLNLDIYIEKIINYILNNGIYIIRNIFKYIGKLMFIVILSMCILLNITYIKKIVDDLKYKDLIYNINNKLKLFLLSNIKIVLIQFIEYTIIYFIIGHPNYLLLAILNSINQMIPFVGVIFTNIVAITTASVISKKLLILTSIISIVMPQIDSYIINPIIYKNSNNIPQTLYLITLIILSTIFGVYGLIVSLPLLIVIIEILKYKNIVKDI